MNKYCVHGEKLRIDIFYTKIYNLCVILFLKLDMR